MLESNPLKSKLLIGGLGVPWYVWNYVVKVGAIPWYVWICKKQGMNKYDIMLNRLAQYPDMFEYVWMYVWYVRHKVGAIPWYVWNYVEQLWTLMCF